MCCCGSSRSYCVDFVHILTWSIVYLTVLTLPSYTATKNKLKCICLIKSVLNVLARCYRTWYVIITDLYSTNYTRHFGINHSGFFHSSFFLERLLTLPNYLFHSISTCGLIDCWMNYLTLMDGWCGLWRKVGSRDPRGHYLLVIVADWCVYVNLILSVIDANKNHHQAVFL